MLHLDLAHTTRTSQDLDKKGAFFDKDEQGQPLDDGGFERALAQFSDKPTHSRTPNQGGNDTAVEPTEAHASAKAPSDDATLVNNKGSAATLANENAEKRTNAEAAVSASDDTPSTDVKTTDSSSASKASSTQGSDALTVGANKAGVLNTAVNPTHAQAEGAVKATVVSNHGIALNTQTAKAGETTKALANNKAEVAAQNMVAAGEQDESVVNQAAKSTNASGVASTNHAAIVDGAKAITSSTVDAGKLAVAAKASGNQAAAAKTTVPESAKAVMNNSLETAAFITPDDAGNDFFSQVNAQQSYVTEVKGQSALNAMATSAQAKRPAIDTEGAILAANTLAAKKVGPFFSQPAPTLEAVSTVDAKTLNALSEKAATTETDALTMAKSEGATKAAAEGIILPKEVLNAKLTLTHAQGDAAPKQLTADMKGRIESAITRIEHALEALPEQSPLAQSLKDAKAKLEGLLTLPLAQGAASPKTISDMRAVKNSVDLRYGGSEQKTLPITEAPLDELDIQVPEEAFRFDEKPTFPSTGPRISPILQPQGFAVATPNNFNDELELLNQQLTHILPSTSRSEAGAVVGTGLGETVLSQAVNIARAEGVRLLVDKVQAMMNFNQREMEIRLDPPELGAMQIRVRTEAEQAQINFVVQNQQAKELLEQSMSKLKDLLEEQGLSLGDTSVEGGEQGETDAQSEQQASGRDAEQSQNELDEPAATVVNKRATDSQIDYYA